MTHGGIYAIVGDVLCGCDWIALCVSPSCRCGFGKGGSITTGMVDATR